MGKPVFLWLDDLRNPYLGVHLKRSVLDEFEVRWVRTFDEFGAYFEVHPLPAFLSFDHDLGEESLSGLDCLKHLTAKCMDDGSSSEFPEVAFHTANPVGKEALRAVYSSFLKVADR